VKVATIFEDSHISDAHVAAGYCAAVR
jgi:hypothetical protein